MSKDKLVNLLLKEVIAGVDDYADVDMPINACTDAYCKEHNFSEDLEDLLSEYMSKEYMGARR